MLYIHLVVEHVVFFFGMAIQMSIEDLLSRVALAHVADSTLLRYPWAAFSVTSSDMVKYACINRLFCSQERGLVVMEEGRSSRRLMFVGKSLKLSSKLRITTTSPTLPSWNTSPLPLISRIFYMSTKASSAISLVP